MARTVTLLDSKRAVVTGGANGIGAAIVKSFAASGAAAGSLVLDLGDELRDTSPAGWTELSVDLRDDDDMTRSFSTVLELVPSIDVLVGSAGIVPPWSGISALDFESWDQVFRVNARSVAFMLKCLLPGLHNGSSVVVVASMDSWRANPTIPAYAASKHAVLGLVRSAAQDLGSRGIRVNAVAPGPIATAAHLERMRWRQQEYGISVEQTLEDAKRGAALRRIATADEVASAVLFLASSLSSGISGHLLPVDAGIV